MRLRCLLTGYCGSQDAAAERKFNVKSVRLSLPLLAFLVLLSACVSAPPSEQTVSSCPPLPAPPMSVVDVLEAVASEDADAAVWVVDLERHYQAIDACNAK